MNKKRIKNFIIKNEMNLMIGAISIIAFFIGCFAIGIAKSLCIIGIIDILLFSPNLLEIYHKKRKGESNMAQKKKPSNKKINQNSKKLLEEKTIPIANKPVTVTKKKPKKQKKKGKIKRFFKWFLIGCFIIGIILIILATLFIFQIIKEAPEFDPNRLDRQEATVLYFADGAEITKIGAQKREKITYDQMPEVLVNAIVATEDSRFFQHNGFDLPRFLKASIKQVLGKGGGGASTITMQVSKNNYTSREAKGIEGIKRKFTDIYMSIFKIEKKYTKEQILEFYVNDNYLGGGSYGVEQACLTYFGKNAKDINLAEASLIAGLFQSPSALDPYVNPEGAQARRETVLYLMQRHGYITKEEREAASKITIEELINQTSEENSNPTNKNEYQGFINTVVAEVIADTGLDPYTTPMKVYTTLNKSKQDEINKIMTGENFNWENPKVNAGVTLIDTQTGAILAVGTGRHEMYSAKVLNYATIKHQIGSTAKPLFDYGPAIEYNNWGTGQLTVDEEHGYTNGGNVNNWDLKYMGMMTIADALRMSRNIPAIKTFQQVDNKNIKTFVSNLHLSPELEGGIIHEAHSIGGYAGESPLTLAAAYNAFANGGYYVTPHSYTKIEYRDTGETVEKKVEKTKAMSEETAYMIMDMLMKTPSYALGKFSDIPGVTYGAKTGTTNFASQTFTDWNLPNGAINDLWVVGSSPTYTLSLWYGYDKLEKENIQAGYISKVGTYQHEKLFQVLGKALFETGTTFNKPNGVIEVQLERETYPLALPSENTPSDQIVTSLFKKGTEPTNTSNRFSTLENVTNLKGSSNGNKVTLTWNPITTPWAIDTAIQTKNYQPLFKNSGNLNSFVAGRIGLFGNVQYIIYQKNNDGSLSQVGSTAENTISFNALNGGTTTYIVKSAYTNYGGCISTGAEVSVKADGSSNNNDDDNDDNGNSGDNNGNTGDNETEGKVTVSYRTSGPITASKDSPITNETIYNYIKIVEIIKGKEVEIKDYSSINISTSDNINYDIPGNYTITVRIKYKNKEYNLPSKTVIVK